MELNKLVDFPTAKLLKEKGFNLKVVDFYNYEKLSLISDKNRQIDGFSNYNPINWNSVKEHYTSAPFISDVVDWLLEKHGVWISVDRHFDKFISKNNGVIIDFDGEKRNYFETPKEAYLAAIEYTLKHLI